MANLAYLKLAGVKGPAFIKSDTRLDHIPLLAVTHDVGSPPDTDGPGERLHHPIVITKFVDFTTPKLHRSLSEGEVFENGWINFFHMPRSGDENNYYSIVMTGIQVVAIKTVMPTTQDPNTADIHEYEEVSLAYKGISWQAHAPAANSIETNAFSKESLDEPEAKFGFDWLAEGPETMAKDILTKVKDDLKEKLKAEAKKKFEDQKKK
jgi:type VI secretion system Hcp family effector